MLRFLVWLGDKFCGKMCTDDIEWYEHYRSDHGDQRN